MAHREDVTFGRRAALLAEVRIAGKGGTEGADDEFFHRAVGGADQVLHTLGVNGQIGPVVVVSAGQLSGLAGNRLGRQDTGRDVALFHDGPVLVCAGRTMAHRGRGLNKYYGFVTIYDTTRRNSEPPG